MCGWVCMCVRACVRACVHVWLGVCVCVCVFVCLCNQIYSPCSVWRHAYSLRQVVFSSDQTYELMYCLEEVENNGCKSAEATNGHGSQDATMDAELYRHKQMPVSRTLRCMQYSLFITPLYEFAQRQTCVRCTYTYTQIEGLQAAIFYDDWLVLLLRLSFTSLRALHRRTSPGNVSTFVANLQCSDPCCTTYHYLC